MKTVSNFIDGRSVNPSGDEKYEVFNPAFGKVIAKVKEAKREEINEAVDGAVSAQRKWEKIPVSDRIKFLFKLENIMWEEIDELAKVTTAEHGKTFQESKGDIIRAIQNIESAAAAPYHLMGRGNRNVAENVDEELIRVPLGVVSVVSPFNFPIMIPFWFIPYAIALGNAVVVKPSEKTPLSMEKVMEYINRTGFPSGLIQLINGGSEAVNYIIENQNVKGISFIGSTPVAKKVYEKGISYGKRVQAGASAKNYVVVMPDANMKEHMGNLIGSFFGNAGERCLAGSVLLTFSENHDKIVEEFKKESERLKIGYGMDSGVDMGPLIRNEHLMRVKSLIEGAEKQGAKIVLDGRLYKNKEYPDGFFLGPSILDGIEANANINKTEIFGPVATVVTVEDFEDAIDTVNQSTFGNASTIYTSSGKKAREYSERINAGNIGVNIGVAAPIAYYPFGGMKDSFFGDLHPQGGEDHVLFFTDSKVVISRW